MGEYEQIRYEKLGRIARVTMDRPRYRNAQSRQLLEELDAAFEEAARDDDVRAIILAGEGEHFSSGHDIGVKDEMDDREYAPVSSASTSSPAACALHNIIPESAPIPPKH